MQRRDTIPLLKSILRSGNVGGVHLQGIDWLTCRSKFSICVFGAFPLSWKSFKLWHRVQILLPIPVNKNQMFCSVEPHFEAHRPKNLQIIVALNYFCSKLICDASHDVETRGIFRDFLTPGFEISRSRTYFEPQFESLSRITWKAPAKHRFFDKMISKIGTEVPGKRF